MLALRARSPWLVLCTLICLLFPGLRWPVGGHCRVAVPGPPAFRQPTHLPRVCVCWGLCAFGQHDWCIGICTYTSESSASLLLDAGMRNHIWLGNQFAHLLWHALRRHVSKLFFSRRPLRVPAAPPQSPSPRSYKAEGPAVDPKKAGVVWHPATQREHLQQHTSPICDTRTITFCLQRLGGISLVVHGRCAQFIHM
jgi:hypothetical protein